MRIIEVASFFRMIQKTDQFQGIVLSKKTGFKTVLARDIKKSAKHCWEAYFRRDDIFQTKSIINLVKKLKKVILSVGFVKILVLQGKEMVFTHKYHTNKKIIISIPARLNIFIDPFKPSV
ncbi:hypothetical protein [Candidatus Liberibacter solanacearum]|nr:hypothetical protein [Candidatus Liberibacter solanacearum]